MSKIVKAKLVGGRPIILAFQVDGEWINYEAVCPKCETKTFVIGEDKLKIACTNQDCFGVIFLRQPETVTDMSEVTWKV